MKNEPVEVNQMFTPREDDLFAIIVYDFIPEFMPHVAFRRDKQYQSKRTKDIKCPHCSGLLKIVESTAKIELLRYSKKASAKVPWHKSMPCHRCHNMIGIIYHAA